MRSVGLLTLVAFAAALGGCGGPATTTLTQPGETEGVTETAGETGEGVTTDTAAQSAPELAQECDNPEAGYTVRYPSDWHTNSGDVAPPCSFFHPEPFEVPVNTDAIGMAILVNREPVPFARVAGEDRATRVVSREQMEIDGRAAVRREVEATGEGLFPAGQRGYQYLVDLDGETLIASTYDADGLDFATNREVLDAMAQTLTIG